MAMALYQEPIIHTVRLAMAIMDCSLVHHKIRCACYEDNNRESLLLLCKYS